MMELKVDELINDKWIVKKLFSESGQGQSAIVVSKDNADEKYVLKLLKNIQDTNNIDRFTQEIELLTKLSSIERIPSIVEKNLEQYYYVMEYIEGKSLEDTVQAKKNRNKFDKALTAIMQLLDIVNDYNKLKVIHRDIKPANIICKDGNIDDIYLIDFGIGHDLNNAKDLTEINVQLGNRFLKLPELQNGNKRDIRSDITMCIGIFYFMLTGCVPVNLIDENMRKPHQTEKGIVNLQWVGTEKLKLLNKIFNKGFENDIEERFQNVNDLIFALNEFNTYEIKEVVIKRYSKKTQSFCMETISSIISLNSHSEKEIMQKLKLYDNKIIAIGFADFVEIEDKLFIRLNQNNILKQMDYFSKYKYVKVDGLYLKKKEDIIEIMTKQDSLSELKGKIHFKGNTIEFTDFIIQNSNYEIPVKRFLELNKRFKLEDIANEIICCSDKVIFLYDNSFCFIDYMQEKITEVDLSYLFDCSEKIIVSDNLKWIIYKDDDNKINAAKLENGIYHKKENKKLCSLCKRALDYVFYSNDVLILGNRKLILFDIENNCIKEEFNIPFFKGMFLDNIHHVSFKQNLVVIKYFRTKRKLYINWKTKRCKGDSKIGFVNYISSMDDKYIYSSKYDKVIRRKIDDDTELYIYDESKSENGNTIHKEVYLNELKCMKDEYFFLWNNREKNDLRKLRKARVCKIVNGQWVRICDIEDVSSIVDFFVYPKGLITINETNEVTLWKMYN